ncbi:DNA-binding transcriptional regulator, MocR family, contains an aminotransferase domain [Mesorhizobium albiziae]|uniref:DNA-binding transcriptional regulator, MocR family, contains an aminotransferase domain n=1 Tax=Neomesorhizobium albiziae TaxID=335020 RepID=A0A1I4EIM8_9HYPH|nr:PLP-dependent aminotransferase family protein [Mesorhizobium albiziae]GLS30918.1 transcriptional regulator [Mesorhizobium albiziae]SFL05592.1 DNA-binding transcriptional regulator, MocR family, contains an aminotransferase domain [Mesorhizobium albiziae]
MSTSEYLKLADEVASEIVDGRLKPGDRLPPQRTFAYQRGIAASTASRVYAELLRRGLVVGEVGRGTFISGQSRRGDAATRDPGDPRVDLEFNFPILPGQAELMAKSLAGLSNPDALQTALKPATSRGNSAARELGARVLARGGWMPDPEGMAFTGGGRQSIAAAIATLVPAGARCGVEALTYPLVKGIAMRLGVTLVPIAMDDHGIRPDAIEKAHHEARLSAVYIQPTLHNPLGVTVPPARREELVRLAERLALTMIEDAVYGFLVDEIPLAGLAPNHCVFVDSLSKRVAPGLTLGFISAPVSLRERLMASIRSGGWTASGFAFAAAQRLITDGVANELVNRKREDARQRQSVAADCLAGQSVQSDSRSYHLWLTLPERWRSQAFVTTAARHGIAITPSSAFAVSSGYAPNAVRLALAAPPMERLREALQTLARMLNASEQDFDFAE